MYALLLFAGVVASSSAFLDSLYTNDNCTLNQFVCRNNKCIPNAKRCDGLNDCLDDSDEEDCERVLCKEPNYFQCANKRCIATSFVCDGDNDCEDFSDEENCESFKASLQSNSTCPKGHWQCADKLCIPTEWVCNFETDCLDGSDETLGCSSKLECDGFKCSNNHCIPNEWRCDKNNDCLDNSDELDCENYLDPKLCTWNNQKFLCANNKTCIDLNLVCDGHKNCPDNSDESTLCKSPAQSCNNHGCSHDCVQMPTGPKCLCPKGYHNIDEKHCKDINECEIYGICDQKCDNTPGSYECTCEHKYILQEDKKTCKVVGGEAMMVFSSKTEIRAYMLTSEIYFPIVKHLKQVVGISYDGNHIYWTDIFSEHESIVRIKDDGSGKELLVTSGLGLPEDLAVDWLTNNIYFTDAEKQHIGVCTNDGLHCTVLINKDIRKPRAIVLNVDEGTMYWTDWGAPAEIGYSSMDGSNDTSFVTSDIHWPNGLTLDYPSERLYWTDAKRSSLESIRLDGTDRRIILEGIVKHPYAIAVFENRLYWSDWSTHSIQSCDKFTGKQHHTLIKENREYIYGISIFHSALRRRADNPCAFAFCSDICLLNGASYTCACPQDKELSSDKHTCKDKGKKQMLVIGGNNMLVHMEHQILGKHEVTALPPLVKEVGALAYNSINNTLYVSDIGIRKIVALNLNSGTSKSINIDGLGKVVSMDFDHYGGNLYWCDEDKAIVEVFNLYTQSRKTILHDMNGEIPQSIALIPEEGVMFVALKRKDLHESHIDRFFMDGTGRTHSVEFGLQGPISLYFDTDLYRVFWTDAGTGNIESTSVDGDDRHGFRSLTTTPVGIAGLNSEIFWVNERSKRVYWAQKQSMSSYNKKITLDISEDIEKLHLVSVTPKLMKPNICQYNNGNCSHLCLLSHKTTICACPVGMELDGHNNKTCYKRTTCSSEEFFCHNSNVCILNSLKCNNHNDCPLKEDEENCMHNVQCPLGHFQCKDGECIEENRRCNHHFDCRDKSDEQQCELFEDNSKKCPPEHFRCGSGQCIQERFVCDGINDCNDDSDEGNCVSANCEAEQFRCLSGSCIPKSWECDHEYDCVDLSDEHVDCNFSCPSTMFTCANGKCIEQKMYCDQTDNCGDNSDEINCAISYHPDRIGNCSYDEYSCLNSTVCIPSSGRCNGTSECPNKEDEIDCSNCGVEEFLCDNKRCIPNQWLCDNINDCGDNSDEKHSVCLNKKNNISVSTTSYTPLCESGFRCTSGVCIDFKDVCNGKRDCYDGSDEDGSCPIACKPPNNPCEHECIRSPLGPKCKCYTGFRLSGDGHSCIDIDECETNPPVCSQLCINNKGNFTCDCYDGYLLRSDRISCKAKGTAIKMIYTTDNEIRQIDQKTMSLNIVYSDDSPKITGLDVDVKNNFIYFSIENTGTIHRINQEKQTREYIKYAGQPQTISLDWSTNNIYYVNGELHSKSIGVCNFDEKVCTEFMDIDLHRQVSALTVDPVNKVMFYTLTSWWVFNSPNFVIYKCNLDGSEKKEMVKSTVGYVTGLTFDFNKKYLYYVDQHSGTITKINYNATEKQSVFTNLTRPQGLHFFEDNLYVLTAGGLMNKCKLFGIRQCDSFKLSSYSNDLVALAQESLQPPEENVCRNHTCEHICVPAKNVGYKCVCQDGTVISNKAKCGNDDVDDKPIVFHKTTTESEKVKSNTGAVVTVVVISICMILLAISLYWMVRRRNSDKLVISMRFLNPTYGQKLDNEDDEKPILQPGHHEYANPIHYQDHLEANESELPRLCNVTKLPQ